MSTNPIESLDLDILRELELDGRRPVSEIAKKLGISRHHAGRRIHALLNRKMATILAFTNPRALGYRTLAIIGIQVSPGYLHPVADRLCAIPNVLLVLTSTGRSDIVIWTMFTDPTDLSTFSTRELGAIPGIISNETTIVLDWWVSLSPLSSLRWQKMSFSPEPQRLRPQDGQSEISTDLTEEDADLRVDQLDVMLLKEIERDPRRSVAALAKRLHISRPNAGSRVERLIDKKITRVVAFVSPFTMGYRTFAMIGMKAAPKDVDSVLDRVRTLPSVYWVAKVAGRYDVIAMVVWPDPIALSRFLGTQVGIIPGITSMETVMGMDTRKMSFAYVASSHLQLIEPRH